MTNIAVIQLICLHINGSILTCSFSLLKNVLVQQGQMIKDGFTGNDVFIWTTETWRKISGSKSDKKQIIHCSFINKCDFEN